MMKSSCGVVILSEALHRMVQGEAKDLLCDKSRTERILRRPDEVNRDSSE